YSGVRPKIANIFIEMLNKGVTPVVFEKGSVGTSGDLSPMAQLGTVALGEGEAFYRGERIPGGEALKRAGIEPVDLTYKEGLGLINGSQMTLSGTALLLIDARNLLKNAFIASAMTIDALKGVAKAYDPRYHSVRPFKGQNAVAHNLRLLMDGSEIMAEKSGKVQDGYSMRCTPQVIGPSVDTWFYVREQIETEMNSSADNPLFFPDDKEYIAGGNFHGQVIGMVTDFLCIAMSEIANLSERHSNRLLNPVLSGLPDFLVEGRGLNSGLMVAQYTAAALVSENKVLSHPSTVDSISVSADQEDHVAMTPVAVRKCTEILKNVGAVLAIEMYCAAQAMDFRKPLKPGRGTKPAYDLIRKHVDFLEDDRVLYPDINKIAELVRDGSIVKAVEKEVGELQLRL
ncbi:MAG: histidine ammonia-lyase, partial [candidate division Zixibacteria bacterium]|nr:histidine ammonia-lyase [candidate division Zixibacteria bacterium]